VAGTMYCSFLILLLVRVRLQLMAY